MSGGYSYNPPWALDLVTDRPNNNRGSNSRNRNSNSFNWSNLYDESRDSRAERLNPAGRTSRPESNRDSTRNNTPINSTANVPSSYYYGGRFDMHAYLRDLLFSLNINADGNSSESRGSRETGERHAVEVRRHLDEEARRTRDNDVPLRQNVLTVKGFDLHIDHNTENHRTNEYDCTNRDTKRQLVIRRGQGFVLSLDFQRPWSSESDDLFLEFSVGKTPREDDRTLVYFQLNENDSVLSFHNWGAKIVDKTNNSLTIEILVDPDAIVGEWECKVTTANVNSNERYTYTAIPDIYILFNPWSQYDPTYYPGERELEEYVLNEYGCVFKGAHNSIYKEPWFYGQFRGDILKICMYILRLAFEGQVIPEQNDPIVVSRKLSYILNANSRKKGVMIGNWSGNYRGGKSPSSWKGSTKILEQFFRTKESVKYAQCWVFCHVFTTVCRALGLPCRSLTNYESAHDTNKSVTIDTVLDEWGNKKEKTDSIWNYHCWNEVWINYFAPEMQKHSGWHAVDATPQEKSNGVFQCGPCPVSAIKDGELSVPYDANFIYGEVNADVCTWIQQTSGKYKLAKRDINRTGKRISTKIPDGMVPGKKSVKELREDITHTYKYQEGTENERASFEKARGHAMYETQSIPDHVQDIVLEIVEGPPCKMGSNYEVRAILSNNTDAAKRMDRFILGVVPIDYRGERIGWNHIALEKKESFPLPPGRTEIKLTVQEKAYLALCDHSLSFETYSILKGEGIDDFLQDVNKVVVEAPPISINLSSRQPLRAQQPFSVTVMIENPTSKPMTNCILELTGTVKPLPEEGFKYVDGSYEKKIKDIFPKQMATIHLKVTTEATGRRNRTVRELDIQMTSANHPELTGSLDVNIS